MCGLTKLLFEPAVVYCNGCGARIKRGQTYYITPPQEGNSDIKVTRVAGGCALMQGVCLFGLVASGAVDAPVVREAGNTFLSLAANQGLFSLVLV